MPRTAALVAFAATISNAGCNAWPALPPHTKEAALEHWSSFYAASSEDLYGLLGVPRSAGRRESAGAMPADCSSAGVTRHQGESKYILGCSVSQESESPRSAEGKKSPSGDFYSWLEREQRAT